MLSWNYWEEEQYEFKSTQLLKLPELGVFESFEKNKSAIAPLVMLTCLSFGRASPIWKYHPTATGFYLDLWVGMIYMLAYFVYIAIVKPLD